jgi:diguanylate cyclase
VFREKLQPGQSNIDPTRQLEQLRECADLQSNIVEALVFCLKEFTFDLNEIGASRFKSDLDELVKVIQSGEPAKTIQRTFDSRKESILSYIATQETYFRDKEQELKDIIDVLRDNLTGVLGSNRDFASSIYDSSTRIEQVSQLDDIRRVKERLKSELVYVRKSVQEKQHRDTEMMETLSKEVDSLRVSLEKAKDDSMLDALTGAGNRMGLDMALAHQIERNKVSFRRFCLLMCDLDHFKNFNDTYGHQVGDLVLRTFVRECKGLIRDGDFIGRYGGEEFGIIIPGASLSDATRRAEKIRSTVASRVYTANRASTQPFSFTVSIGVSEARKEDSLEDVVRRADLALYAAKNMGRNKVATERQVKMDKAA